jgi:hypothetical protein
MERKFLVRQEIYHSVETSDYKSIQEELLSIDRSD